MSNLDTVLAFLKGKGLSSDQAAGVAGNLQIESGINPAAENPGEGAIGIAQWEGGRRTALDAYAARTGGSETDLNTQLGYLWSELQGPESGAYQALMAANSPAAAATAWDQSFERSDGSARQARIDAAQKIAGGGGFWEAVTHPLDTVGGAVTSSVASVFAGWQTDLTTLGLKLAGAAVAGALVVVGAREALRDGSTTA